MLVRNDSERSLFFHFLSIGDTFFFRGEFFFVASILLFHLCFNVHPLCVCVCVCCSSQIASASSLIASFSSANLMAEKKPPDSEVNVNFGAGGVGDLKSNHPPHSASPQKAPSRKRRRGPTIDAMAASAVKRRLLPPGDEVLVPLDDPEEEKCRRLRLSARLSRAKKRNEKAVTLLLPTARAQLDATYGSGSGTCEVEVRRRAPRRQPTPPPLPCLRFLSRSSVCLRFATTALRLCPRQCRSLGSSGS